MPPQARDKAYEEAKALAKELGKLWKPDTNYIDDRYFPRVFVRDGSLGVTGLSMTFCDGYQLPYTVGCRCYGRLVVQRSDDKIAAIRGVLMQVEEILKKKRAQDIKQIDKEIKFVDRLFKTT